MIASTRIDYPNNTVALLMMMIAASCAWATDLAGAQQIGKVSRIGWLASNNLQGRPLFTAFLDALKGRGYVEGQNLTIEYRSAEGKPDRLPQLAAELVKLKVEAIIAPNNAAAIAAREITQSIPIIFVYGDPVADHVVASLSRPGGNLTGLSIMAPQLSGKRLELIKEALPKIFKVGVVMDEDAPIHNQQFKDMLRLEKTLSVKLQALPVQDTSPNIEAIFTKASSQKLEALVTLPNPIISFHAKLFIGLAVKSRLPAMYPDRSFPRSGGLISYGPDMDEIFRRVAYYVERILKGANPSELPVEQPTKFEMIINLRTAKQLGVTIPQSVLYRANRVIS